MVMKKFNKNKFKNIHTKKKKRMYILTGSSRTWYYLVLTIQDKCTINVPSL